MSPEEQTQMVLAHVDRMAALTQGTVRDGFAAIHKRLDVQDEVQRDHGKRLARIEGGDEARKDMFTRVPKPAPTKRMPRWQRLTLSTAAWLGAILTALGTGWAAIKPLISHKT